MLQRGTTRTKQDSPIIPPAYAISSGHQRRRQINESITGQHCKKIDYTSLEPERFFLET
jgi:hypothetical protein